MREVPVNWSWSEDQSSGISITDNNGRFRVNLTDIENLGNYTLGFTYLGDERRQGSHAEVNLWVVSRTYINVQSTSPNIRSNGDLWEFTAVVTDDNRTPFEKDGGQVLNSCAGEMQSPGGNDLGGNVTVIFEGIDFEDRTHRQIVSVECPASGSIGYGQYLDPQLLKDDPFSFLPDGFGPGRNGLPRGGSQSAFGQATSVGDPGRPNYHVAVDGRFAAGPPHTGHAR